MEPLIFRRLAVEWGELIPDVALPREHRKNSWLRTFPGPGDVAEQASEGVQVGDHGMEFPTWGQWRIAGPFGVLKLLLVNPATAADEVPQAALGFVASNIWHGFADEYLCRAPPAFLFDPLAEKFFRSDQPLGLHCGSATRFLAAVLDHLGYRTRMGSLKGRIKGGHLFLEVWLSQARRWTILDADFGVMLRHGGTLINAEEMTELLDAGRIDECELVDVARKSFPRPGMAFSKAFVGQITWRPEFLNSDKPATQSFRENVFGQQLRLIRYWRLVIDKETEVGTRVTTKVWNASSTASPGDDGMEPQHRSARGVSTKPDV